MHLKLSERNHSPKGKQFHWRLPKYKLDRWEIKQYVTVVILRSLHVDCKFIRVILYFQYNECRCFVLPQINDALRKDYLGYHLLTPCFRTQGSTGQRKSLLDRRLVAGRGGALGS